MAMDVGKSGKGPQSSINVTPLVDIVLVLLIIFMVLTPSMLKHLTANVPQEDESDQPPVQTTSVMLEYTADRKLLLNNSEIPTQSLAARLSEKLKNVRKKVVFFKAHEEAPYGEVVRLMDVARGAGAETLAVVTEPDKP
jgi:biopolymer transport protein ExbD